MPEKLKNSSQATPIKEVQDMERVKQILLPMVENIKKVDPLFPNLAVHEETFYYMDDRLEKHYSSILPVVDGQPADQLVNSQIGSLFNLNRTMTIIGRALGEFHYQLASNQEKINLLTSNFIQFKTIVHGDFHLSNIFIAPNEQISFIDNTSIADSLITPQSPFVDIFRLYSMALHIYNLNSLASISYKNLKHSFLSFIKGYAQAFPESRRFHIEESILRALRLADKIVAQNMESLINNNTESIQKTNDTYGNSGLNKLLVLSLKSLDRYLKNTLSLNDIRDKLRSDIATPPVEPVRVSSLSKSDSRYGYYIDKRENTADKGGDYYSSDPSYNK